MEHAIGILVDYSVVEVLMRLVIVCGERRLCGGCVLGSCSAPGLLLARCAAAVLLVDVGWGLVWAAGGQTCGAKEYVSVAGTGTSDVACAACGSCGENAYASAACAAGNSTTVGSAAVCTGYTVRLGASEGGEGTRCRHCRALSECCAGSDRAGTLPALCSRGVSGAGRVSAMDGRGGAR